MNEFVLFAGMDGLDWSGLNVKHLNKLRLMIFTAESHL